MDRRVLLAVVISIAILIGYQEFVLKRLYPPPGSEPETQSAEKTPEEVPPLVEQPAENAPPPVENAEERALPRKQFPNAREVTVDTDLYTAVFTAAGGRLQSFKLKKYRASTEPGSPPLEMINPGEAAELPLGIELRGEQAVRDDDVLYRIEGGSMQLSGAQKGRLTLVWQAGNVHVEKRLEFTGNAYPLGFTVAALQLPQGTNEVGVSWEKGVNPNEAHGRVFQGVVALLDNKIVHRAVKDLEKGEVLTGNLEWAGYGDTYFLSALVPEEQSTYRLWLKKRDNTAETRVLARVKAAKEENFPFEVYVGPKDVDVLDSLDHGLKRAIDFGYFAFLAVPMLQVLRLLDAVTGNYGIAIILLTVAIKILFIPLTQKSFTSMREMQKLQPQMTKLRERLKDKPEEMNKEIMELYRRHKVNPLGGCLPMILQIPVFFALYSALLNSIELRHAPFAMWINDLSAPDRLGNMVLPFVNPPGIPVLTVVMGVTMLVQQWMTPSTGDPTQRRMMMIMPLVFTFMFVNFPAGLVLYWLVNNVLTIAQQYYITRSAA